MHVKNKNKYKKMMIFVLKCLSRNVVFSTMQNVFNFVCKLPQYTREDKVQDTNDELQDTVQEKISDAKKTIEETKIC